MTIRSAVFGLLLTVAASVSAQPTQPPRPTQPAAPPPACTGPEHRQFDFWLGWWDVYPTGRTNLAGRNLIEKLYGGCTIRENWTSARGTSGGSLNMYDPTDKRWHQTWQDSQNSRAEFDGGLVDGKMILMGFWPGVNGPGQDGVIRMIYTPNADGTVRQLGEVSTDHGATWQTSFDFTYRKSASPPPK